jgi:hypothetical protein
LRSRIHSQESILSWRFRHNFRGAAIVFPANN